MRGRVVCVSSMYAQAQSLCTEKAINSNTQAGRGQTGRQPSYIHPSVHMWVGLFVSYPFATNYNNRSNVQVPYLKLYRLVNLSDSLTDCHKNRVVISQFNVWDSTSFSLCFVIIQNFLHTRASKLKANQCRNSLNTRSRNVPDTNLRAT